MKGGRGLAIAAVIGLGLWAWQKGKVAVEPARKPAAEPARVLVKEPTIKPIYGPFHYLPPHEIPTDYTQRIRKSYYDDLWNRGEWRWQLAANTFWDATEKATEYSDIYPVYMEAYDMAVTQ